MATESLAGHALVMAHVRPHVVGHRSEIVTLGEVLARSGTAPGQLSEAELAREFVGAGEAIVVQGAPHHAGAGRFLEVSWPCGCGQALHADPERVLRAWARHCEQACGIDVARLEEHFLASLRGARPLAICACGQSFTTPDTDPWNSDLALAGWDRHVRELAQEEP